MIVNVATRKARCSRHGGATVIWSRDHYSCIEDHCSSYGRQQFEPCHAPIIYGFPKGFDETRFDEIWVALDR